MLKELFFARKHSEQLGDEVKTDAEVLQYFQIAEALLNKAWYCHMPLMAVRILNTVTGNAHWQHRLVSDQEDVAKVEFLEELLQVEDLPRFILILQVTLLVLGVFLDALCWKYRKLALILFAYECVYLLLNSSFYVD